MKILITFLTLCLMITVFAQEELIPSINLNDMEREELTSTIPDFGGRMVREFFEYQPYISIQQFRREIGKYVDEEQVSFYEQYVFVPVDINESDAASIMQIPGVDEVTAESLLGMRPFESNDVFLAKLAELVTDFDTELASRFLTVAE